SAYNRYIKVFWDGDNAVLDGKCDIQAGPASLERSMKGKLIKKSANSVGHAIVNYNGSKVVEGKYDSLTETKAGCVQNTVHGELINNMVPIGADYIHKYQTAIPGVPTEFTSSVSYCLRIVPSFCVCVHTIFKALILIILMHEK
ncbi:unnamed protein product, partial [Acanthoscelides obtectus]